MATIADITKKIINNPTMGQAMLDIARNNTAGKTTTTTPATNTGNTTTTTTTTTAPVTPKPAEVQKPAYQAAPAPVKPTQSTMSAADYQSQLQNLMGSQQAYKPSENVVAAQNYLQSIIANKPGSYQSKYTSQLESLYNQIMNREDFHYDINGDALYQQYKDQYTLAGQNAMRDTMARAAALTGGYGSSYATTAGNQAYQAYLQQLNEVVPELYAQAYGRYMDEGQELLDQYALVQAADQAAYGRWLDSYNNWLADRSWAQGLYDSERSADYTDYTNRQNQANALLGYMRDDQLTADSRNWDEYLTNLGYANADRVTQNSQAWDEYLTDKGNAREDALIQGDRAWQEYLTDKGYAREDQLIADANAREDKLNAQNQYTNIALELIKKGKMPNSTVLQLSGLNETAAKQLAKAYGYRESSGSSSSSSSKKSGGSGNDNNTSTAPMIPTLNADGTVGSVYNAQEIQNALSEILKKATGK
ncbi:MAG: hypothetical protein J6M10_03655 [Clostridia bacterium]|nr:hypothetical protein [Clostridia bacterium]